ncbi:hypothetical protein ACLB2K_013046 [Fragaria x ananassa]
MGSKPIPITHTQFLASPTTKTHTHIWVWTSEASQFGEETENPGHYCAVGPVVCAATCCSLPHELPNAPICCDLEQRARRDKIRLRGRNHARVTRRGKKLEIQCARHMQLPNGHPTNGPDFNFQIQSTVQIKPSNKKKSSQRLSGSHTQSHSSHGSQSLTQSPVCPVECRRSALSSVAGLPCRVSPVCPVGSQSPPPLASPPLDSPSLVSSDSHSSPLRRLPVRASVLEPYQSHHPFQLNLGIFTSDNKSEFSVLVDRATGGSCIQDGQVEMMLHRRLLVDDGRGVGEALDETVCISNNTCQGLTIHMSINQFGDGAQWRRTTGQEVYSPLLLAFTHEV